MNFSLAALKKNPLFKFVSSVRLAVPLMLLLAVVVAAGTIVEAEYNAQYAGLIVYKSWWFQGLLCVLWLNIFMATLSRLPFRKHHLGFVVTHIGLLTLLIGSLLTYLYGLDGQLRVVQGDKGKTVVLSDLVVKYRSLNSSVVRSFAMPRRLSVAEGSVYSPDSFEQDTGLQLRKLLPFITPMQAMSIGSTQNSPSGDQGPGVKFNLQSQFFNVDQELNLGSRAEAQMGPATLRLILDSSAKTKEARSPVVPAPKPIGSSAGVLVVRENGAEVGRYTLADLKKGPARVKGFTIEFVRSYEQAVVADNKRLEEQGQVGKNPAIEFFVVQAGRKFREVKFSKFPTFGMAKVKIPGVEFVYEYQGSAIDAESTDAQTQHAHATADQAPVGPRPMGNVIEFHLSKKQPSVVVVELYKAGAQVLRKEAKAGDKVQTPWMGMAITINDIAFGGESKAALPAQTLVAGVALQSSSAVKTAVLPRKMPMLPSAVWMRSSSWPVDQGVWIAEGDSKIIKTANGEVEVYYGPDTVDLPFAIELLQFQKIDYPGTSTPKSFQSTVRAGSSSESIEIKMNEPLERDGYILYQASYEMAPGAPTASIFSVNKDPGRFTKYFGAVILSLGIVIFTLMRSRWYLNRSQNRSQGKSSV